MNTIIIKTLILLRVLCDALCLRVRKISILFFLFSLFSCAQAQVQDNFYLGLLSKAEAENTAQTISHFEKALKESNVFIRQAAATELANLMYEGAELAPRTIDSVRREAAGTWALAFETVASSDKDAALNFLLNFEQNTTIPNEARLYTLREFEKKGNPFNQTELAAIHGHFAVSRFRYNESLLFFRGFMEEGEWPQNLPGLFIKYPSLINDLGRAFQYTNSGNEGAELFLRWEENLATENFLDKADEIDFRYRLVFFAARIARRRGETAQALELFETAFQFQISREELHGEQIDACIWYILDLSLNESSSVFIDRLEQLVPYWHNHIYFNDILEKFLQSLVSNKEWDTVARVYDIIKEKNTGIRAAYAYVASRAIEEGFLQEDTESDFTKENLLRAAYEAGNTNDTFALFYRLQSAAALGLSFKEIENDTVKKSPASEGLQFLLGFFAHGAEELALPYVRALESELTPEELRMVAAAFADAEMYALSIRQVSRYINREGYTRTREDLELLYPRPFKEQIEKYAEEHGIEPELMFALVRTESAFQPSIVSRAGAVGLAQLMPETAADMANRLRRATGTDYTGDTLDLNDPVMNLHIGSFYLNHLINRFEDTLIALLAYNGGQTRVRRWRNASSLPADLFMETISFHETRDYGRKVLAAAAVYRELYY